jgi:cytochrome c oxidase assembly protein subunit 11
MTKNIRTVLWLLVLLAGMVTLTAYSSTLYDMFCRITGYGGTPQQAAALPDYQREETINVSFNTDVTPGLPLEFTAEKKSMTVNLGAPGNMVFRVKNTSSKPLTVISTYNVTPEKAALFFQKVKCFCFEKHTLQAGEEQKFPVLFFIDPSIADSRDTRDLKQLTLHYTYFEAKE